MHIAGALLAVAAAGGPAAGPADAPTVMPTRFEAGHFFAVPRTVDGQGLRLIVDTGGGGGAGLYWLSGATAQRLGLKTSRCTIGGERLEVAPLPRYAPGQGLPAPESPCGPVLLVNAQFRPNAASGDGQLGAGYLPGRVWTFDYPARRLVLEPPAWQPDPAAHATPLGFRRDAKGHLESGFPRLTIRVDGQPLDMLLDTGATAHPTAAGKKASGTPTVGGYGVTSYITTSMLEHWHQAHPDWRVVDQGDDLFGPTHATRLIRVPAVEIAGWSVGPVWFTERPDRAFHVFMSSMMDKRVEGAVGGNVFGHFAMTIDYPHEKVYFRCRKGCRAAR
ncbi:hypothetical protein [Fulvimonas yonginensis]|uniref:Aspartyl protease n=1 Tax=Fulvimonas yonginensis TaxID=1495200 RepID=A0ABU8J9F9_9GAMM